MAKKFLMLALMLALASCAFGQSKMDKAVGSLNGMMQIYEQYESLYRRVRRMYPVQVTSNQTVVRKTLGKRLKSLTWSSLQIECKDGCLYFYRIKNGDFTVVRKYSLYSRGSLSFDVDVAVGSRIVRRKVVVIFMDKAAWVYYRQGDRTLESYTFKI